MLKQRKTECNDSQKATIEASKWKTSQHQQIIQLSETANSINLMNNNFQSQKRNLENSSI